jgi:glutamyl/glutaminyl-tRNA synthetase
MKSKKIQPITKQDKKLITLIIQNSKNWITSLYDIDREMLVRSLSQIMNDKFDYISSKYGDKNSVFDILSKNDTIFRFAPSPSGYLHIGHFVPLLLNILLKTVSRKYNNKSDFIIRIDDTNPNESDYSQAIINTITNIVGNDNDLIFTRSSDRFDKIIELIDKNILSGANKFYVDLTNIEIMRQERADKKPNMYRSMQLNEQIKLWEKMKLGELINAVVRAKIDINSDNGNLRDPVMLRFVNSVLCPTYDLACPVLDALDQQNYNKLMIGLRDSNYFDRLEQYRWIQDTLELQSTAVLTFSRINFENLLLSKRKIKKLIENNIVENWSDPRLMTIDGLFNRGLTLNGLLHFYWLNGRLTCGNRSTSQDISTLFDINNKVLSQYPIFILDRLPISFTLDNTKDINDFIKIKIIECKQTQNIDNNNHEIKFLPELICISNIYAIKSKIITHNLKFFTQNINFDNLDKTKFKKCSDIDVGEIIKINNFKNTLPPDGDNIIFGGYYKVISKEFNNILEFTVMHIV